MNCTYIAFPVQCFVRTSVLGVFELHVRIKSIDILDV